MKILVACMVYFLLISCADPYEYRVKSRTGSTKAAQQSDSIMRELKKIENSDSTWRDTLR